MKHLKLFFALFAMLALGVGNAWGAETTVYTETFEDASYTTSTTYNNSTEKKHGPTNYQWGVLCGTPNTGAHNGSKAFAMRYYKSVAKTPTLTQYFDINSVDRITFWAKTESTNNKLNVEYSTNGGSSWSSLASNISVTTSYKEYTYDFPTQQSAVRLRFTMGTTTEKKSMFIDDVAFIKVSSGSEPETPVASLSANPTTIDFGTVYQGADVESKTVAVNFENLNDNVTYSGLSTPFNATGTVSNDGDKITIAANTATIGEYSQTLTITSAADSKTAEVTVKMNVVEKPAPTGIFTLHTGDLIEGDYVIVDGANAMNNTVTSNRLQYNAVTISNNEIVDPLAATIWHIAPNGEYWTIYSAAAEKYAASTSAKNQATLAASVSDNTKWTVTMSGNTFDFENLARSNGSDPGNKYLRKNGSYGFACYAGSTGGALSLYRKAGAKYNVNVNSTTNGTVTADPTSAEAGTTITLTVDPDDGYVLEALAVTSSEGNVTVTANTFTMPASDVEVTATFKENEKPAATLTLSKNGVTEDITGNKQDDVVKLPSTVDTDCVKEFVGWSADASATEPEYAPGASYTLASTSQTLYAVYATAEGGEATASVDMATYANDNSWGSSSSTNQKEININSDLKAVISEGGNSGKYYDDGVRIYQTEDATVTVSTAVGELKSVKFTFTIDKTGTLEYNGTPLTSGTAVEVTGTSATFSVGNSTSATNGQVRFTAIEVVYTGGVTYSNYSTTCSAALANPTFSLTEGKYTEAKSVEITAAEGTIYYTTDGTEPTASNTQYTSAIALNDCGEYTIKAIAISSDSQSDVVSATYTIKLPLTNSQAAPYTEAEAIAVYDGGCYDNQDVYVKGTVKTATFNSTYGNYTITLTNGFQFYRFLQAAETKFTEDIIVPGDVLVACGKLIKYNTTYQLAEGCYLVERIPYEGEKTDISNTEATAYTVDQAFALIADVSSDLTKEVYVKGLVAVAPTSNPTADGQMTYSISDNGENTGNVLKVYLGLNLNGEKFTSKEDVKLGDYVVVKGKLLDYNSTYELNKGNQLVQHVKAATISIADITMEVGETKTIAATITPAAAETAVVYTIKENTDNAISLSGNTITANAVGTATITATIATAAEYMGKTVDFTVTVTPESTSDEVVILAELDGKWYAMKGAVPSGKSNQLDAIEVTYFNGTLYNVPDEVKASITWTRSVVDGKATFVNNGKYLKGGTSTDLTLVGTVDNNCKWMWNDENGYYTTNTSGTIRTFLYRVGYNFKNYGASQAGKEDVNGNYSELPVVTAPVYVNLNTASVKTVENAYFSVGNNKYVQFSTGNLQYEVGTNTWSFASEQYEVIGGAAYDPANPTNTNYGMNEPGYTGKLDLFGWSSDGKFGVNPSNTDAHYGYAGSDFVDWGELVNETGWYTLTKEEMNYILNRKKDGKKLWALATVCNMNGLILLPDNWDTSITLDYGYVPANFNYTKNQIDDAAWQTLEDAGAVFLPEGGTRVGGHGNKEQGGGPDEFDAHRDYFHVDNVNEMGYYWLNTQDARDTHKNCASFLILPGWSDNGTPNDESDDKAHAPQVWSREKRRGNSVRLVKEVTPNYTREGQGAGVYGTVCYPENIVWCDGGTLYEVAGKEGNKVIFDEVTTPEAGMPYIFIADQEVLNFFCGTDEAATAGNYNSLQGTFTQIDPAEDNILVDNYMLVNNIIKKCGINCGLKAYRAYFVATDLESMGIAPAAAPGRRRISLDVQSENTTTGLDNITNGENTTIKVIENGQLIIIRNGEKFNAQGVRL